MKNRFFSKLYEYNLEPIMMEIIDWLLDDSKFIYFEKSDIIRFTKKVKRISNLNKANYIYGNLRNLDFTIKLRKNENFIIHSKGDSEGRDLVRHMRNSIAHNHAEIKKVKGEYYFILKDFNENKQPTAYMCLSLKYVIEIYKTYTVIKNQLYKNKKMIN